MNQQLDRTLQETTTTLPPDEVLRAAKRFFTRRNSIYAAFIEKEGPTYVALRGQGGEEVIVGVAPGEGGTLVTGSTYLFDPQLARFLGSLPPAAAPRQSAGPTAAGSASPNAAGGAA